MSYVSFRVREGGRGSELRRIKTEKKRAAALSSSSSLMQSDVGRISCGGEALGLQQSSFLFFFQYYSILQLFSFIFFFRFLMRFVETLLLDKAGQCGDQEAHLLQHRLKTAALGQVSYYVMTHGAACYRNNYFIASAHKRSCTKIRDTP